MGDRIAFGFKASRQEPTVWLYAHWSGSNRYALVKQALEVSKPRWSDGSYATRMAICSIIGLEQWGEETGFGITAGESAGFDLNYDDVLVIHWYNKTVTHQSARTGQVYVDYGFEAFLNSTPLSELKAQLQN